MFYQYWATTIIFKKQYEIIGTLETKVGDYQYNVESPLGQSERVGFADPIGGPGDESPVTAAGLDVEWAGEKAAVHEVDEADGEASADVGEGGKTDPLQPRLQSVRHFLYW